MVVWASCETAFQTFSTSMTDLAADAQDLLGLLHGLERITAQLLERGQKQIAQGIALERTAREAVAKTRRITLSPDESATRHWRMSSDGRTPVKPLRSAIGATVESSTGWRLRPVSTVNVPVPPPKTTTQAWNLFLTVRSDDMVSLLSGKERLA
jgi:hypothetical protein